MKGLWPSTFQKHYTSDLAILWKKMIGQQVFNAVIVVLEGLAAESPFFPRPLEVLRKLTGSSRVSSTISTVARVEELRKKEREYEQERKTDLAFYKKIPKEEKERAAKKILANNPVKAKCLNQIKSLEHPGWRAMILRLLRDGIVDQDYEDVDI